MAQRDPSLADPLLDELRERRSAKWTQYPADVLPAWVAEMDFPLAAPVAAALHTAIDRSDTGYANPDAVGLAEALAGFAARRMDWAVDPEQVVPCHDVVAGLTELLRVLCEPGDGVIVCPPVYHPFFSLVPNAGCTTVEVPLREGRELDLDGIAAALAAGARAVLLCNPQNPTGTQASRGQLAELAGLAAAHEAWVLADEIHAPLTLPGGEHVPFVTVSPEAAARGIALVSASKTFNIAGLGCAQIVTAGQPARDAVWRLPQAARHTGHLGAIASAVAYAEGDEWLDGVLSVLDGNRALLADLLAEQLPEVGYTPPAAGYLTWLDVFAIGLGDDAAPAIMERGRVALSPGPQFGRGGEGFVRLNVGTSPELVAEAVRRIAGAAGR
jgi:cystathionine beta-lyase